MLQPSHLIQHCSEGTNRPISKKAKLMALTFLQAEKREGLCMLDTGAEIFITDTHQNCP